MKPSRNSSVELKEIISEDDAMTYYGEYYPRFKTVPIVLQFDKLRRPMYFQTLDPMWKKRISKEVVESLEQEGRIVWR